MTIKHIPIFFSFSDCNLTVPLFFAIMWAGLDEADGGLCRSRVFDDIVARAVLPSGELVYEVTYIVGSSNIIHRWEKGSRCKGPCNEN